MWILSASIWPLEASTQYDFGSHALNVGELLSAKNDWLLDPTVWNEKHRLWIWVRLQRLKTFDLTISPKKGLCDMAFLNFNFFPNIICPLAIL